MSGKYLKIKRLPPRPSIANAGEGEKPNCATTPASHWLLHLPLIQIEFYPGSLYFPAP
jgi:hypothetical protein